MKEVRQGGSSLWRLLMVKPPSIPHHLDDIGCDCPVLYHFMGCSWTNDGNTPNMNVASQYERWVLWLFQVVGLFQSQCLDMTTFMFPLAISWPRPKKQPGLFVEGGRGSRTRTVSGAAALFASRSNLKRRGLVILGSIESL